MISKIRQTYNHNYTNEAYTKYLGAVDGPFPDARAFRLAETPVFLSAELFLRMQDTATYILNRLQDPQLRAATAAAAPPSLRSRQPLDLPDMMVLDFGLCAGTDGHATPLLIECQGFPSLFALQHTLDRCMRTYLPVPEGWCSYTGGMNENSYLSFLRCVVVGESEPDHTILLEWKPEQQRTRIDFRYTEKALDIRTICLSELRIRDQHVCYPLAGRWIPVSRIYNRVIFEELPEGALAELPPPAEWPGIRWVTHPEWYYRISKHLLPFLAHEGIPETRFLHEAGDPPDLTQQVLKPLFSYSGQGVKIHPTAEDIKRINDPERWILQRRHDYLPLILSPDGKSSRTEVRLFVLRDPETGQYLIAHNLARLSRGDMIGSRFNLDETWVGGTLAFFPEECQSMGLIDIR